VLYQLLVYQRVLQLQLLLPGRLRKLSMRLLERFCSN
jgi:hypothetical protein